MSQENLNIKKVVLFSTRLLGEGTLFPNNDVVVSEDFCAFFSEDIQKFFKTEIQQANPQVEDKTTVTERVKQLAGEKWNDAWNLSESRAWDQLKSNLSEEQQRDLNALEDLYTRVINQTSSGNSNLLPRALKDIVHACYQDDTRSNAKANEGFNLDCPTNKSGRNAFVFRFSFYTREPSKDCAALGVWPLSTRSEKRKDWLKALLMEVRTRYPNCEQITLALHDKDLYQSKTFTVECSNAVFSLGNTNEENNCLTNDQEKNITYTQCVFQHSTTDPISKLIEVDIASGSNPSSEDLYNKVTQLCSTVYDMMLAGKRSKTQKAYEGLITKYIESKKDSRK